ncbi:NmrA family NAD(P)-binding protein [Marinobacter xestospongiae]|uniref:NmrA family NAD(P)-binding protein n=1 Tax=Marinobacter xestospongiae TaxID=994319 RepID=A0ABU3W3V4_9GAMM|nr:NmrA family NAD(P)-binding protein [Marinobacter xestospongiae]MDV2080852.1 NmrA family NAD(P)-binding protein [Marinobacter xestospongiae]
MSQTELYVVTGATGRTGAAAANALLRADRRVRVVVRNESKGAYWSARGAEVAVAEFTDHEALVRALAGADGAYIVSPPQYASDDLFSQAEIMARAIAKAATDASLPKLVALSSIGAEQPDGTGWIAMNRGLEHHLGGTGLPVAFLRAAYFMENWQPLVKVAVAQGQLPSFLAPLERAIAMIATDDIGRIAADVLTETWSGKRVINLEGPARYSPRDVATQLSGALGKPVTAVAIPQTDWAQSVSGQGFSVPAVDGFVEMTQGLNSGHIGFNDQPNAEHRRGVVRLGEVIDSMLDHPGRT